MADAITGTSQKEGQAVDPLGQMFRDKGQSTAPPGPDYVGAAKAQGDAALANTRLQGSLNRPDITTPLGSQTWTQTGPDQYAQNISLSPGQQAIYDNQTKNQKSIGDLSSTIIGNAGNTLSQPFDASKVDGGQQQIQDAMYAKSTAMLDPQFQQSEAAERDRLAQQGFQVGNEGYDKAIGNFDRNKAAAYGDARDRAIIGGQDAQKQAVQEALMTRQQPINEINALQTGSQVTMPTFQSTPGISLADPANLTGAAQQQGAFNMNAYNQQIASQNSTKQAGGALGAAALTALMTA